MVRAPIPRRLQRLETELAVLKRRVTGKPNFAVDAENWEKVRPTVKRVRRQLWKTIVDFTEIAPEGIPLTELHSRLKLGDPPLS